MPESVIEPLRNRDDFGELRESGRTVNTPFLRFRYVKNETSSWKIGYAIGRPYGNAVQRNRLRRRLRHCWADAGVKAAHGGGLILVSPTRQTNEASFTQLLDAVRILMHELVTTS